MVLGSLYKTIIEDFLYMVKHREINLLDNTVNNIYALINAINVSKIFNLYFKVFLLLETITASEVKLLVTELKDEYLKIKNNIKSATDISDLMIKWINTLDLDESLKFKSEIKELSIFKRLKDIKELTDTVDDLTECPNLESIQ